MLFLFCCIDFFGRLFPPSSASHYTDVIIYGYKNKFGIFNSLDDPVHILKEFFSVSRGHTPVGLYIAMPRHLADGLNRHARFKDDEPGKRVMSRLESISFCFHIYSVIILLMILAGTPPTTVLAATSFVTTAPAAITALLPMVTPCSMVAFAPTHIFLPSTIGAG